MALGNLAARFVTAGVLIPVLIAAIQWDNPVGVWAVVFVATALGLREWMNMTQKEAPLGERLFGVALGLAIAATLYWAPPSVHAAAIAGATIVGFLFYLFRYGDMDSVARRYTAMMAGVLYVGVLLTYVAFLKRRGSDGGAWVYVVLTLTWFSDTGAYFAGRFWGPMWPRKLAPNVSPKKTIIGAVGGLAGSFGALVLAKLWYLPSLTWIDCAVVAVPANFLGQMGDLCESLLKRSVGVKDSGNLLPGHGGMLDRVDALLFTAPYVYVCTEYLVGRLG
jgi:phosphatidate cytidylyltransferase